MLYKYRDFSNLPNLLDIFVNQRLYAAQFEALNDPMEGAFVNSKGMFDSSTLRTIYKQKCEWHVLSLSKSYRNGLLWAYYAGGHNGVAIGVISRAKRGTLHQDIDYDDDLSVSGTPSEIAKRLLTRKLKAWTHEDEHRILVKKSSWSEVGSFVPVTIRKVIFGSKVEPRMKELVTKIARSFCPKVSIVSIAESDLEWGVVQPR